MSDELHTLLRVDGHPHAHRAPRGAHRDQQGDPPPPDALQPRSAVLQAHRRPCKGARRDVARAVLRPRVQQPVAHASHGGDPAAQRARRGLPVVRGQVRRLSGVSNTLQNFTVLEAIKELPLHPRASVHAAAPARRRARL